MPELTIHHKGKDSTINALEGSKILSSALKNKIRISHLCQSGICGMCQVLIKEGHQILSPPTEEEKILLDEEPLSHGVRLACQAVVKK